MFTNFCRKPFFNKPINLYCFQSTMNSIQNIIERYKEERKFGKITLTNKEYISTNPDPNNNNNIKYIIFFLSMTPLMYLFLKNTKKMLI